MTTENVELQAMLGKLLTAGDGDFLRGGWFARSGR